MKRVYSFVLLALFVLGLISGITQAVFAQPAAAGANKFLGNITSRWVVRSDFLQYWNQITGENEHKWSSVEGTRDRMTWAGGDSIAAFARRNNIPWRYHTLIWGSQYPSWMAGLSREEQLAEITEWLDAAAARYPDVQMIDVVNEGLPDHAPPDSWKDALGGDGATGFDWIITAFRMVRERWPHAILKYNDYNIVEWEHAIVNGINLVRILLDNGAPIDAIGIQCHDAFRFTADQLRRNIDRVAAAGLPIFVTEYDIPRENDQEQLEIMRNQFPVMWNHPSIVGITYWGYIVGQTWVTGTGLKHDDGRHRPALTWLLDFVRQNPNPPNNFPNMMPDVMRLTSGLVPPTPGAPSFTFGLTPATGSVAAGGSVTTAATITPQNGLTGNVTFSLVSPPAGITLSGGPVNITGTSAVNANLSIAVAAGTAATARTVTVRATSGTLIRDVTFALTITTPSPIPGRIEAESFASMFGLELRDNAVGGGVHIAHINSGDSARYLINVQSAGEYLLRVRAATAIDANSTITFRNSAGVVLATVTVDASQTNGWQEWYVATARITLPAGAQDLRVAFAGGTGYLCNVDWFEIVPVPVTLPGRVQAENFASMQGVQVEPDAGGVLNVGWINQGDWVRYLVDVSETGRYVMRFRVATAATANSNMVVRNQAGTILGTLVIDTARSNGWHDWYVDSITVDLNVGLQELTLEFAGTDFLFNMDWFELSQPTTSVSVMREFETVGYSVWSAPNPFIDEVVIFVEAESSHEGLKVEIYNIRGEKVFESRVGSSGKIVVPNAANLQSGIYYIVLSNRNQKLAVKSILRI